jgi:peptidyl-prolyl cis-trans isomerase B (cyclophilin B)
MASERVLLETNLGVIELELDREAAPKTVGNFLEYVDSGYYDGTLFHRVIAGFMIQGGGYDASYEKKNPREALQNEARADRKNVRGTVAMARTGDPHSARAGFFVNVADNAFLDHRNDTDEGFGYAVFGKVIAGMDVVDAIARVTTGKAGPLSKDAPLEPVVIRSAKRV